MTGQGWAVVLVSLLMACVRGSEPTASGPCAKGLELRAGACFAVVEGCGPSEVPIPTGGCLSVGVTSCVDGFVADGAGGCAPVLPKEGCAPGTMTLPGETSCHLVAPCGDSTYGDAPADALHVDGSYAGADSDGSLAHPYARITDAIGAARANAVIAIAAGNYVENLAVLRPMTLWGRCPSMVEVSGDPAKPKTYTVDVIASSTVRGLAITGPYQAISVRQGAVTLEGLWVHDAGEHGVDLQQPSSSTAGTQVTLKNSLVERNHWSGILVLGARATIDSVVVRDTAVDADGLGGMGINLGTWRKAPAQSVSVHRVLAERNKLAAISVTGVTATIDASVLRDTGAEPSGAEARGLGVWNDAGDVNVGVVTLTDSFVSGNRGLGVHVVSGKATLERVVVRDQVARVKDDVGGTGIDVAKSGELTLRDSLVVANHYAGVQVNGSKATLERCLVLDTAPDTAGDGGFGLAFTTEALRTSEGAVFDTLVRGSRYVGIAAVGSRLSLERVVVDGTRPRASDSGYGDGIAVSSATLPSGFAPAALSAYEVHVRGSARAAMSVFGAQLSVRRTLLTCGGFDLEVSRDYTARGEGPALDYAVDDGGETICGCNGAWTTCTAQSSGLEPITRP